jgi:hypothetical protein
MLAGFSEAIILGETNYVRFERFCLALCERVEKMPFVPTSTTWDQGRDGRSIAPGRGSHRAILCATLDEKLDEKVQNDLTRVAGTTRPDRLIYCCSQRLSEHKVDQLSRAIRTTVPGCKSVAVLGATQLSYLAEQHLDLLQEQYSAELRTIESNLLAFESATARTETKGLRLALLTFGSEDAKSLRQAVSRRAVLDVLKQADMPMSDRQIVDQLSKDLCLPTSLNLEYVRCILETIRKAGLVAIQRETWQITARGRQEAESVPLEAAQGLLEGRSVVAKSLETLTGRQLDDDQFELVWSTLLDFLSDLFYSNGIAIIATINQFIGGAPSDQDISDLGDLIQQGAARVGATFSIPEVGTEYEQAIHDMFVERSGEAFDWLSRVCERFIALCALGLEDTSSAEIRATLQRYHLVLDSDIVLTVLCEGEPDHKAVRQVLARFRQLGGRVLVSQPVLEEVAYHAHISDRDFNRSKYLVGRLTPEESGRYTNNAFVRGFFAVSKDPQKWPLYRNQFAGTTARDYSKILDLLQSELMVQVLPSSHDKELARGITEYIKQLRHDGAKVEEEYYGQDPGRAGRDGQLLAAIARARAGARQVGGGNSVVLLSSSYRLRKADRKFRPEFGEPEAVLSLRALSYMLYLVPDVSLGAGTMRQALFDFGQTAHLTDVERLALRVIRGSGEFNLPWARRRTLENELDKVIRSEASKRGVNEAAFGKQVAAADKGAEADRIIVEAVKNLALRDAKDVELAEAKKQIRNLEGRLHDLETFIKDVTADRDVPAPAQK